MLVTHTMDQLPEQGTFDLVASFGALGMYLTKPCMEAAVRELVRLAKPGGQILLTHMLPPGWPERASIFDTMPMRFWYAHAKSLGVHEVVARTLYSVGTRGERDKRYLVKMKKL